LNVKHRYRKREMLPASTMTFGTVMDAIASNSGRYDPPYASMGRRRLTAPLL
jgi:hypothetical protein